MKKLLLFLALCLIHLGSNAQIRKASVSKLERKLKKEIQLVDVRTEKEFKEQRIGNAVNINVDDPNFKRKIESLDKSKPVYLYCRSGKRSDKAAKQMTSLGFKKIYDLKGGIVAWNEKKAKAIK